MILRKTPSVFLRTLRTIPAGKLPILPAVKLSARRQKRLEDAVFARIAKEQNRTIFDAEPIQMNTSPDDDAYVTYDSPFEMTVIEPGTWKRNLRRSLASVLAACLCFAVLAAAVLYRHDIALFFAQHSHLVDTDVVPGDVDTQALNTDALIVPDNTAEGFSLEIFEKGYHNQTGYPTLIVHLTRDGEPMKGISVQYSRVMLSLWDPDVRVWRTKYDVYTSGQPIAAVMAGDLHFPMIGQEAVSTVEGAITIPRDIRDYTGVWCLSLEGLTLVRDDPDSTKDVDLIAEVLTNGTVHALFQSRAGDIAGSTDDAQDNSTVPQPPESVLLPHDASNLSTLLLSHTKLDGDTVTLDLVLNAPAADPDGYAVYYRIEETERWNDEKQVWESKHGTDFSGNDTTFAKMLMAGDVHFVIDDTSDRIFDTPYTIFGSVTMTLPDDGWYRLTLRELVLVREAVEGEEAAFSHLMTEEIDHGAVSIIFYKE